MRKQNMRTGTVWLWVVGAMCIFTSRATPLYASVVISDTEFPNAHWTTAKIYDSTNTYGATFASTQQTTNGNPGAFRQTQYTFYYDGSGISQGVIIASLLDSAPYNPATQGSINAISWSLDRIFVSQTGGSPGVSTLLILQQNGRYFVGNTPGWVSMITMGVWETLMPPELRESDFTDFFGTSHPDFSATGGPIIFGYANGSAVGGAGSGGATTVYTAAGTDNFVVNISSTASVPLPAAAWGGLVLMGGLAVRRFRSSRSLKA